MVLIDRKNSIVAIKGAGETATGVAVRLRKSGFPRIIMLDIDRPQAVRRTVSFSEAINESKSVVEGIEAVLATELRCVHNAWKKNQVAILVDPH